MAAVPDVSQPSVVPFGIALGGLVGYWFERARGAPQETVQNRITDWSGASGTLALAVRLLRMAGVL